MPLNKETQTESAMQVLAQLAGAVEYTNCFSAEG